MSQMSWRPGVAKENTRLEQNYSTVIGEFLLEDLYLYNSFLKVRVKSWDIICL